MDTLIRNIGCIATPAGKTALRGQAMADVECLQNAAIGIDGGRIAYVGPERDAPAARNHIDAQNSLVTPGLIDAHTHMAFGGWRQHELAQKLEGKPYLDILREGGGILSTVRATRAASEDELFEKAASTLEDMFALGVTTLEAKSGYGLRFEDEAKQLRAIGRLNTLRRAGVVATFLGAHALPGEYADDRGAYVDLLCDEMLPAIAREKLAEFCDVFCEQGVFTAVESERILLAARKHGFGLKMHVDEIADIGGAAVAARLGAVSAEHLLVTSAASMDALAQSGVVGVLLPLTSLYLDKGFAPARDMLERGLALAVASDFNPGSNPCANMQLALQMACFKYRLPPKVALTAGTLNAAAALRRAETLGSVEIGKQADLVIWNAPDLDFLFYQYGGNLARTVIKNGVPHQVNRGTTQIKAT